MEKHSLQYINSSRNNIQKYHYLELLRLYLSFSLKGTILYTINSLFNRYKTTNLAPLIFHNERILAK